MTSRSITAVCLIISVVTMSSASSVAAQAQRFPDMERRWFRYREAVDDLAAKGVIGGYPDGTFKPEQVINRAELLKIIFRAKSASVPISTGRRCFRDVNPDQWYAPYVCTAKQRGVIKGYRDGSFRPADEVNMAEAIKIILNTYSYDISEESGEHWYKPYTQELDRIGVFPEHAYLPWAPLTRERAADLIWRVSRHDEEGFLPQLSKGCGRAPGNVEHAVQVRGQRREFLLTVPSTYSPHDPTRLIIAFHGRTSPNESVRQYYRLDEHLTNAIIAYPEGVSNGNGSFSWSAAGEFGDELRGVELFDAIVQHLSSRYCIDMDDISVVGHSLGGWITNSVACVRGDVVRASVSVGSSSTFVECAGPAAAMIIHNPDDRLAPFSDAERVRIQRTETNACSWDLIASEPDQLKCVMHDACSENPVLFCPHENDAGHDGSYYPHNWPRETARYIRDFLADLP